MAPRTPILQPPGSTCLELGIELACDRLACQARGPRQGLVACAGYCVVNDVSEREFQTRRPDSGNKG